MRKTILLGLAFVFLGLTSIPVWAADRTVCFRLKLRDDRWNCATTSEAGNRRGCNRNSYVDVVGHHIQLWDKDSGSADEYIGTWYVGGGGTQCATFAWEGASYQKGEKDPDVYLRYINKANRTGYSNYIEVEAVDTDGSAHIATTWRNGEPGNPNQYVAMNCKAGAPCYIFPSGSLVPTNDIASERALWIMALDSAQHAIQVFGEIMDRHVKLRYPGRSSCSTSCTVDRKTIHITQTRGNNGFNVAHEMGHIVQMQEFDRDSLRDDCSRGGSGHSLTSLEHESCATTEGFADYVGVVSWYEPNNAATVPFGWGRDFETATLASTTCSDNAHIELQVAKAFWDLDDWNQSAGVGAALGDDDELAYGTTDIARGWRQFASGTGNRENNESGQDGVNMRDYYWNNTGRFTASAFFETFIRHNCLQAQDND